SRAITSGGSRAITSGGSRAITSGGSRAITSGGSRAITSGGSRLLVYGRVEVLGSDFVSVLGQTVFLGAGDVNRFSLGTLVAVYGSIDLETSSIVDATVVDAGEAGFSASLLSYLTGIVDAVDYENGTAIVSGLTVDYNALLAVGVAPRVGDQVAVTGYHYRDLGMLVAVP
ncbi:MAG: hypothetical protein IIC60_14815, partial [Proteobacteria bacterium]|nr:hypothetical protein [Pseudomonadota bacterium]